MDVPCAQVDQGADRRGSQRDRQATVESKAPQPQHPRPHGVDQIPVAPEELAERVLRGAVTMKVRRPHAVFVVGANEVREFGSQLGHNRVVDRLIEVAKDPRTGLEVRVFGLGKVLLDRIFTLQAERFDRADMRLRRRTSANTPNPAAPATTAQIAGIRNGSQSRDRAGWPASRRRHAVLI